MPLPNTYSPEDDRRYPARSAPGSRAPVTCRTRRRFIWRANPLLFVVWLSMRGFSGISKRRAAVSGWWPCRWSGSAYVGGDAWEYWGGANRYISIAMPALFVLLSTGLFELVRSCSAREQVPVFTALIVYSVIALNSIYGPAALRELALIKAPLHSGPGDENHQEVEEALFLRQATTARATIALTRAGTIPYFSGTVGRGSPREDGSPCGG